MRIINILKASGFDAFIVGGAVRDRLLHQQIKDVDITTSALPSEVKKVMAMHKLKCIDTGIDHGTVTVIDSGEPFEVTTFRKDVACDGRRAIVEFTSASLRDDMSRRDFTINALALDGNNEIVDFFDGVDDLNKKIIRTVGDPNVRFIEDKLRILRAVRFSTVLDFSIESKTFNAIKDVTLEGVSHERIRDELIKILVHPNRMKGIRLMEESSLLNQVLPEIIKLKNVFQDEKHHPEGNVFNHTMMALNTLDSMSSIELILSVLLHDVGKNSNVHYGHEESGAEITEDVLRRLKFPSVIINKVVWLVKNHMKLMFFSEMREAKKLRLIREDNFPELFQLFKADRLGRGEVRENFSEIEEFIHSHSINELKQVSVKKFVTGFDVMKLLNIKAGIEVGTVLSLVEDAVLENKIHSREEAMEFINRIK